MKRLYAEDDVDVGLAQEAGEHRGLVHAGADGSDHALRAELLQRRVALAEGRFPMVVGVVQIDDVDPVEAEASQAFLDAAADAVGAEVPAAPVGVRHGESVGQSLVGRRLGGGQRVEQTARLRGHRVLRPRPVAQGLAEAAFGEPEAVVRCGVEVTDALLPGRVDRCRGLFRVDLREEVADRRCPEGEFGDLDRAASEPDMPHAAPADGPMVRTGLFIGSIGCVNRVGRIGSQAGAGTVGTSACRSWSSSRSAEASRSRSGSAFPSATSPICTRPP